MVKELQPFGLAEGRQRQTQSFADMFNEYMEFKRIQHGKSRLLSVEQQQLLEWDSIGKEFARYFGPNPESSDDYYKLKDAAYAALEVAGTGSPLTQAQNWWFDTISNPYYEKLDPLYNDVLDRTNVRDKPLVYMQIRNLPDQFTKPIVNETHPEWGEFVSPEENVFIKLNRADRRRQTAEGAHLPATFLPEF